MAFSSINPPLYLDPPNWQQQQQQQPPQPQLQQQQQQQQQQTNQTHHENNLHHHPHHLPPPSQQPQVVGGSSSGGGGGSGSAGSIRPGSMTDRARLAKLPQPEQALKCPRCDSINTKFCYFNNYSLSQPRHFCKTCRRYWTRGGALRNVPVGGGCRRNKRSSKSSNSNNSSSSNKSSMATTTSSSSSIQISNSSNSTDLNCHLNPSQLSNQLPNFMASLHHFGTDYGAADHLGLNFNQQPITGAGGGDQFQMGISSNLGGGSDQQWRFQQMQQFPFMGTLEAPLGLYPFQDQGIDAPNSSTKQQPSGSNNSSLVSQFASVKMEESHQQGLNLSRQFLANINQQGGGGGGGGNGSTTDHQHQYWSNSTNTSSTGNAWTDLSGFNSSSTSHLL